MPRRIFVYGDSHTRALAVAASKMTAVQNLDVEFSIRWAASDKPGVVRGDLNLPEALEMIAQLSDSDLVAISFLGTAHNVVGLLEHERPFWVMESNAEEMKDGYELIPRNVMKDMFETAYMRNKRVASIKSAVKGKLIHLMTPPPKFDDQFIKSKIKSYRGTVGAAASVASPQARLRLWQLDRELLLEIGQETGMTILDPPSETLDQDGFLKSEYWGNDATHANEEYGALVLQQLARL